MGEMADLSMEYAIDDMEHYERYCDVDLATQYEEGLIDETGAEISNPNSLFIPVRQLKSSGAGPCPICGAPTIVIEGKFGRFRGCMKFPQCKGNRDF